MRTTDTVAIRNFLRNLEDVRSQLFKRNKQVSSGKNFTRPSESPVASARVLRIREETSRINQYFRNIQKARVQMASSGDALNTVRNMVNRVVERANFAINGTSSQDDRNAIAGELQEMLEEMVRIAGTSIDGKRLFSGSLVETEPFTLVAGNYVYQGDNQAFDIEIARGQSVQVNATGDEAFTAAGGDLLNSLNQLIASLQISDINQAQTEIGNIDNAVDAIDNVRVRVLTSLNQLDTTKSQLDNQLLNLTTELSGLEDVDMAEAISDMLQQETSLRAALGAGSRLNQPNLFDVLG